LDYEPAILISVLLPTRLLCDFKTSILCLKSSGEDAKRWLMSAYLAAILSLRFSPEPPTSIGMDFWTGGGELRISCRADLPPETRTFAREHASADLSCILKTIKPIPGRRKPAKVSFELRFMAAGSNAEE
jgi:hypothetical protein